MNVCFVTSECVPYVKTGGLADVSGALPVALSRLGVHVKLILPLYDSIRVFDHGFIHATEFHGQSVSVADEVIPFNVWYGHLPDSEVEVYLVDCPRFFHGGRIYTNRPDEVLRFVFLQHAAIRILQQYAWSPDIIHANDWQTALLPRLIRTEYAWDHLFGRTRSILTIHNLAYQGHVPEWLSLRLDGVGNCLEDGIRHADRIVTVSPTYAREIQTYEFGEGLDGWLRSRGWDLDGILNGMDTEVWNPASDPHITTPYSAEAPGGKQQNRSALLKEFGLPAGDDSLVVGVISRFATQKGLDLLLAVLDDVLARSPVTFVVLGSGDAVLEDGFRYARQRHPERLGLRIGYDEALAHRIEAGADAFLMPSRYEPCGLNQMYSMRYGTLPIVHATGGLADTVIDLDEHPENGTGFIFRQPEPQAMAHALTRAVQAFRDGNRWAAAMRRGMQKDFSWDHASQAWLDVYRRALAQSRP
ncbi:MAG: glycogen synthase GlgA [Rhodothermales bacterium]